MRAPFFLLLLADDLSRSFMPMFAAGLQVGPLHISPNLVASLPIFAFMLVVALSQPVLGGWSERIGRRRSFLAGAALACVAHLLSAQASTLLELLIWRSAGGAAWAIAFVAAQGYVLDHTDTRTRTVGLAAFVGIIMVSMICGPSIGGILADGIGHRATLALGAALTLASLALAWRRLPADHAVSPAPSTALVVRAAAERPRLALAFSNRRFLLLLVLAAVPAKLILIAYCFYLIPLYIVGVGSSSAMAGRMIMLYSVMMVLLVPLMANWVVAQRARHADEPEALFVAIGLGLSGLAGLAMALPLGLLSPLILVFLLGVGQSLSISPQAAMVAEVCKDEIRSLGQSAVYGVYRMVERMGNAIGPLVAAALLEIGGFQTAFIAIGALVLLCAALFAVIFLPRRAPAGAVAKAAA
jgi:MFS family permease